MVHGDMVHRFPVFLGAPGRYYHGVSENATLANSDQKIFLTNSDSAFQFLSIKKYFKVVVK